MKKTLTITVIGGGNVAFHLVDTFLKLTDVEVKQLYNRSCFTSDFDKFEIKKTTHIAELKPTDLTIIAVKDDAIADVSARLPYTNSLVVHTSGNTDIDLLNDKNRKGVFYPLQSFSKAKPVDFRKIPLCLEAKKAEDLNILCHLAESISENIYEINSFQRKILHISAVFVNNFTNHLVGIGQKLCDEHKIPFEILKPLLTETFEKLQNISAIEAQTGPARRDDQQTIKNHMAMLNGVEKEIYKTITNSILTTYGKEKL